jgi:hypothetical protein
MCLLLIGTSQKDDGGSIKKEEAPQHYPLFSMVSVCVLKISENVRPPNAL